MNSREKRGYMLGQVLSPIEKKVITLRYGIGIPREQTLAEVGGTLRIKPHAVHSIQLKALQTLRNHPMVQHLRDYLTIGDDYESK
jgi:RNA polymerase primary sigma factor